MTARKVVDEVWARRVAGGRPEWTRGLGPNDIRRGLMEPMALRRVGVPSPARRREDPDRPSGGRLRPEERFDDEDAGVVRKWFADEGWDLLITLCGVARAVKDTTVVALTGTEALISAHDVAEWALRKVGGAYWDGNDEPSPDDLAEPMRSFCDQQVAEGPLRRMRLDERTFVAEVREAWDEGWPAGRPALAPRPSELGLGGDARPQVEGWRGNWHHGTDRSLYSRYRGYFDASTRVRPPPDPRPAPEQHVTRRFLAGRPVDVALTEVRRAAAPLGSAHAGHRSALVATARGLRGRAGGGEHLDLEVWTTRGSALPLEPDEELVDAVRTYAVGWTANARLAGELDVGDGLPEKVLHRLWHRLHGREVEWEVPLSRAGFDADLRRMFGSHLHERNDPPPPPRPGRGPSAAGPRTRGGDERGGRGTSRRNEDVRDAARGRPAVGGCLSADHRRRPGAAVSRRVPRRVRGPRRGAAGGESR